MNNLVTRTITGVVGGGIIVGGLLWNKWSFLILIYLIFILSLKEFYGLLEKKGYFPNTWLGLAIGSFIFLMNVNITYFYAYKHALLAFCVCLVFIFELFRKTPSATKNVGFTLLGIVYLGLPYSLLIDIGFLEKFDLGRPTHTAQGINVLCLFLLVWSNDSGAYFVGKFLGKHKLFERISPKKTWEGFFGGLLLTAITGGLLCPILVPELPLKHWLVMAVIIAVTSTLGDLVESMIKRDLNIKDSGSIIPGHGGFLDRFDGFVFTIPFIYFYLFIISY